MLSRFVASALVMFVIGGFILADTVTGLITEHKDGKITVKARKKGEKKSEEKTLKVGKSVKITKGDDTVKHDDFTEMVTKAFDDDGLSRIAKLTPLRRLGDPDELVGPALLLLSDAGSFITGELLTIDGGATV